MATPLPLEGDGLVENLFHYMWTTDDLGDGPRVSVPPTVIYRGSQPVAWYFTSRKSGRIKRKHRGNLTAAHIEHSFTKRKAATDVVAYYLYLPNSESTNPAIEYYDTEALREFLFKRPDLPHSSSPGSQQSAGILQQFSLPKGARNSTLRAIWSPKLCLLERRVNVHAVHDARFSVYERGVTFEEGGGAEALSRPEPVRGSMLPGMVQQLCERVVDHVTRVSYHKFRISRMVLRLQIDAEDRLWLLWSSSLRLQPPLAPSTTMLASDTPTGEADTRPLDIVSDAKVPTFAFAQGSGGGLVSLTSSSCPEVDEEPRPGQTRCASCAQIVAHRALLPTTYKAVLAHFQHVLKFLRERLTEENQVAIEWPPDERVVEQAGGVGFAILRHLKSVSSSSDDAGLPKVSSGLKTWQGREFLVPPVIRYMHPTLRAQDFARHRQDPIFLHKTVGVCERCFLVYADYATASLEANGLGIRSSASAPALLRPVREKPKHAEYFDDSTPASLRLTTTYSGSPLERTAGAKTKPPASAWMPVQTDERQQGRSAKLKTGPRSTLQSLPMAPKLPPRIETFEPDDNDALRIPDGILHEDGSPQQHQQQQREEAFFRELYQQNDTVKRGDHALRHILEAADRLSKAKPQHRLAALGDSTRIGQSQSTGALVGAITELQLAKKPGKSPYSMVQRIRGGDGRTGSFSKDQTTGKNESPAKSPAKRDAKLAKKKISKKIQTQGEGSPNKTQFVSSREKRAAAEHRGYLVAALSDAQVQLEHIESLATLVVSAPDIEADPIEHEPQDKQKRQKMKADKEKRPPSPEEQITVTQEEELHQEQEDQEQHESQPDKLEAYEQEEYRESQLDDEQSQVLQQKEECAVEDEQEHAGIEALESSDHQQLGDEARDADQQLFQETEAPFEKGEIHIQELYEAQKDAMREQLGEEQQGEEQQGDDTLLEQNELQLQDQKLEYGGDEGQEHEAYQELETNQGQEKAQTQEDEDQDEYEDMYEGPDHDQEGRDPQQVEPTEREDIVAAEDEAQNLLEQAQELLATAASPDHDIPGDISEISNDEPGCAALEDDSSDDAVGAADSVVAAALPLPSSDESTSAGNDE
ncbi:hypothetical protein PHYPSEUDO_010000 [Phytophthora pseudosyringae]|uniref:Uncharacterized protein n=1 Tax=Phytophthora pseudosyringae TaxID=221518 RepID=A0A8T1WC19_9STRA|nr:hypothetical protein PHYPSEUDO_010000 [Phytophthora pseudosyringae]